MFSSILAVVAAFVAQALAVPTGTPLATSSVGGGIPLPTPTSGGSPWWLPPSSSVPPTVDICAAVSKAVPLQRAYIGGASSAADHFYTTSAEEMALAVSRHGYKQEADVGKVHTSQESGTVPLYRSFNEPASDH